MYKLKSIWSVLALSVMLAFSMTSCDLVNVDSEDEPGIKIEDLNPGSFKHALEGLARSMEDEEVSYCFDLVYPVDILLPNGGGTVSAVNEDSLVAIILAWDDDHPDNDSTFPELVFPVDIIFEDGSIETIQDEDALWEAEEACFGSHPDCPEIELEECAELVFPVDVLLPGGQTQTAQDWEELDQIIETWFDQHPQDSTHYPTLVYPLQVMIGDSTITVQSDEELDAIFEDCYGDWDELCFEFNYPLDVVFPDSTTSTAQDEEELWSLAEAWYEQNPDSDLDPELVFPVSVTLDDGSQQILQEVDDLDDLLESCWDETYNSERMMQDHNSVLTRKVVDHHPGSN
ncbi:MAG: hypothetical protein AAFV07_06210 [Bacteroidota bacterium]